MRLAGLFVSVVLLVTSLTMSGAPTADAATSTVTASCAATQTVNVTIAPGDTLFIERGNCSFGNASFSSPTVMFGTKAIALWPSNGSLSGNGTFTTSTPGIYKITLTNFVAYYTLNITVAESGDPFISTSKPVINGTVEVGQTLSATTPAWDPVATTMDHQWFADGAVISGATSSTLLLTEAHYGKTMTVKVTGSASGYKNTSLTSDPTVPVAWISGQWRVLFDANGGTPQATLSPAQGSSIQLPASTKTGYTLSGWYTALSGGTRVGGAGDSYTPIAMTTLYSLWTPNTYTVTFDAQGGSSVAQSSYQYGGALTLPAAPTRTGYRLTGWYTAATGGTLAGVAGTPYSPGVASSITLYAQWQQVYTVTLDLNGGSANIPGGQGGRADKCTQTSPTASGVCVLIPPSDYVDMPNEAGITEPAGYQFDGWYTIVNGQEVKFSASFPGAQNNGTLYYPQGDITFTAKYTPITRWVQFIPSGGSQYYSIVSPVLLPMWSEQPGYTFKGWFTAQTGGTRVGGSGGTYAPDSSAGNHYIYAQQSPNIYTAMFDTRGGSAQANGTYTYGTFMTLPAAPNRPGYTFFGWSRFPNLTSGGYVYPANHSQFIPNSTEDFTVYAYWVPDTIRATFNTQGGSAQADKSFATNGELVLPQAPTRTGYNFLGWYTAASGGTKAGNAGQTYKPGYLTADLALHAQWQGLSNTVKFVTGTTDSSVVAPADDTFTSGSTLTLPAGLSRPGYTFLGWADHVGLPRTGTYTPEPTASGEITLTGKWSANRYTVKFDSFGGSAVADKSFETDGSFDMPGSPSRLGYKFVGWFDTVSGGTEFRGTVRPSAPGNFTLYARWEIEPFVAPIVTTPVASLSLDVEAGARVTGATVTAKAEGLAPQAPYEVELRSEPQIIARGNAVNGIADIQAPIPPGLEAGWHTLTFRSTAFDGSAVTRVVYFEINAEGILLEKTTVIPPELAALATTGANHSSLHTSSFTLLIAGAALLLLGLRRRRRVGR